MSIPLNAPHHDVRLASLDPSKVRRAKSQELESVTSVRRLQRHGPTLSRGAQLLAGACIVLAAFTTYAALR